MGSRLTEVGDEVRAGGGLAGTVEQIITGGVVFDPLTESSIVAAEDDPGLVVGTKSGIRAAVAASELIPAEPVRVGGEVTWPGGGPGVVDMVVTAGEVPGVADPLAGTKNAPAARVRLLDGQRIAVPLADLAAAGEQAGVSEAALDAVRSRGMRSWPGTGTTSLSRKAWAEARVDAFLTVVAGEEPADYCRDNDLLPGA
jgi:hypothetical protein